MSRRPELVIFDLDGTLIEYELEYIFGEALKFLPEHGYGHITFEDLQAHFSQDRMFGFMHQETWSEIEERFWRNFDREGWPAARPIHGALETLEWLKERGIRSVIVTSRSESPEEVSRAIEPTGILDYVGSVITRGTREHNWRVKARMFERALREQGVDAASVWTVGDHPSDISSAWAAGLGGAIAVRSGTIRDDLLLTENPTALLHNVGEVPLFLGALV